MPMSLHTDPPFQTASAEPDGLAPLGYYQHYKGNFYLLKAIATHSEELEPYAVYQALYAEFGLWVRPLAMFTEQVVIDGISQPRFRFIGTTKPAEIGLNNQPVKPNDFSDH
jgi:hypothetical protein